MDLVPVLGLGPSPGLGAADAAAGIFAATYVALAWGRLPPFRIDRAGAAVVGAAAMVAAGVVSPEAAYRLVDLGTLVLLFGMMVVVGHLRLSGSFRWVGLLVSRHAVTPHRLLAGVIATAGVLSALFVNDTICLALTPLVLEVAAGLGVRATPYLVALATASNIGSACTLTGNPQNMLIGVASGLPYRDVFTALAPISAAGLGVAFLVLSLVYRRDLAPPFPSAAPRRPARVHRALALKGLGASVAMLGFFFAGANLPWVALGAAALLLLTRRIKPEKLFGEVDWSLLTLFAGLFVVVGAVREVGLTERAFALLHAREVHSLPALAAAVAALSNVVSNVPAVMLFVPLVPTLPDPRAAWLALAATSTLAGNLTLTGSIANLIVAEGARRTCPLTFSEYLKTGIPLTLITLVLAVLMLGG